jgi:ApbE superfamily uncharacterized protein (UPF0280 family)
MYEKRFYRDWAVSNDLVNFKIVISETDLLISADKMLKKEAEDIVYKYRKELLDYISKNSSFKDSLVPVAMDEEAPEIVKEMIRKSAVAAVGPMAGVAGAIAEYTGRALLENCTQVIVENGGDVFIKSDKERRLSIYAGNSPLSGKINLKVNPEKMPLGICTSSGTVGHSKSFGIADAATLIAHDAILADCVATQTGNLVKNSSDLKTAIDYAKSIDGIMGALIIIDDKLATWGEVELV